VKKINLSSLEFEYDSEHPEGYKFGMARFGPLIDAAMLGGTVYEIPPGQSSCPYHYVYPDSDKIGAWAGPGFEQDHVMVRRESHTQYYDGET
jgi:hypothetical protein